MKTTVAIARCQQYALGALMQVLEQVLQPFGGMRGIVQPGWRVLLKPNFVVADPAGALSTTHSCVVEAAILAVKEVGATPVVGDSPAFGSARRVAKACGVLEVCERHGVEVVDLDQPRLIHTSSVTRSTTPGVRLKPDNWGQTPNAGRPRRYDVGQNSGSDPSTKALTISGRALEADLVLNLPKLKAHCQLRLTAAVKNLYGCVSGKRKWWRHMTSGNDLHEFACMLVKNAYLLPRTFTIVDAVMAMHKTGPRHGRPYPLGLLVAGQDPVAVDRVFAEIIGLAPERLATLEAAKALGVGIPDLDAIQVVGEPLENLHVTDFQVPEELHDIMFKPTRVIQSLFRTLWLKAREHSRGRR